MVLTRLFKIQLKELQGVSREGHSNIEEFKIWNIDNVKPYGKTIAATRVSEMYLKNNKRSRSNIRLVIMKMQKVLTAFRFTVRPSYKIFVKVDKTCIITLHKYRIKGIDKLLNFFRPEM